jgi:hypothetical protein
MLCISVTSDLTQQSSVVVVMAEGFIWPKMQQPPSAIEYSGQYEPAGSSDSIVCTIVFGVLLLGCTKDEVPVGSVNQNNFGCLRDGRENHALRDPYRTIWCVRNKEQYRPLGRMTFLLNTKKPIIDHALEHTIYDILKCVCLLLQDLLQSCSRGGEEESGGHVL